MQSVLNHFDFDERLRHKLKVARQALTFCVLLFLWQNAGELTAQEVQFRSHEGLEIIGTLDPRTDEKSLWIQQQTSQIILKKSYDWNQLSHLLFEGKEVDREQLINEATFLGLSASREKQKEKLINFWFSPQQPTRNIRQSALPARKKKSVSNRVASLQIEAYVANWDRDAEIDGLMVHLYPLNERGKLVPVQGDVTFRLLGEYQHHRGKRWQNGQSLFEQLGSWQKNIKQKDLDEEGIVLRLEFQEIHPMKIPDLGFTGLLTADLGVRGQGRFNASLSDVIIKPVDRFRDELQLRSERRSRYAPQESLSPGLQ